MKKIIIAIAAVLGFGSLFSCSDMLETESDQRLFDPSLDQKTDSMYYAFGVLQALQGVADQYYLQGEMRGDLVKTITNVTDKNLQELANFSATTTNKYDSAYQYYRVINNCNYYIAHRDTSLLTGSTLVAQREYVAIKAIRAWAYLQLARNYGKVPFVTEPLTSISQIESANFPEMDLAGIVRELAPDLAQYSGTPCPSHGDFNLGSTNFGTGMTIASDLFYIPVDVILGDLYLENNQYPEAAKYYVAYLTQVASEYQRWLGSVAELGNAMDFPYERIPDDFNRRTSNYVAQPLQTYSLLYSSNTSTSARTGNISFIQMPMNRLKGQTTVLPSVYGYDFYATSNSDIYNLDGIQIKPSDYLMNLTDTMSYYYFEDGNPTNVKSAHMGDMRYRSILFTAQFNEDLSYTFIQKMRYARVYLYRTATVWLHLAEAFNRMGHPDLAFAILKDGLYDSMLEFAVVHEDPITGATVGYISQESADLLTSQYPLLSTANSALFPKQNAAWGAHTRGCGVTTDLDASGNYTPGFSPYQYGTVVGNKLVELVDEYNNFGITNAEVHYLTESRLVVDGDGNPVLGEDGLPQKETVEVLDEDGNKKIDFNFKEDIINAVEELLCEEYALEFAFEGTRYYDLMRLARHKNESNPYQANFGSLWLKNKLKANNPVVDLSVQNNWYLPFK